MAKTPLSLSAVLCAALVATAPVSAQDKPDPERVLATVDGTEITLGHVIGLRADLPPQYDQFPDELLFQAIIDQLIQQTLLMKSLDGDFSLRSGIKIENETRGILASEVTSRIVSREPEQDALRALYETMYPAETDQTEYRAAHILVETEEEAKALVQQLSDGADFAALARTTSTGPSGEVGGDLGWFGEGDMVSDFFDAVVTLSPEEVSPPVQTSFGWHVIKLAETRQKERPEFEAVRGELSEQARQTALEAYIAELEAAAEITRVDTDGLDPSVIQNTDLLEN